MRLHQHTDWSAEVEEQFRAKLARARRKPDYLYSQAHHLCRSRPDVALRLLDEYFALGDHFYDNCAYTTRAEAHITLGNIDKAVEAYECALAREGEFPNSRSEAWLELPFLIAGHQLLAKYERALDLLAVPVTLLFPVQRFKYHATLALLFEDLNKAGEARKHATAALFEAGASHSGLRYHSQLGLAGTAYESLKLRLHAIAGTSGSESG